MRLPAGGAAPRRWWRSTSRSSRWTSRATVSAWPMSPAEAAEAGKGKSQLTLRIQPLRSRPQPMLVPLRPGEQVLSPSF